MANTGGEVDRQMAVTCCSLQPESRHAEDFFCLSHVEELNNDLFESQLHLFENSK